MTQIERVIAVAKGELRVTEAPPGSNRTKYGAAYGLDGYPWCVMFLWWCFREAGLSPIFFGGGRTASCGTLLRWYREQGMTVPASEVKAGDIVILNFHGTKDTEHCGLVVDVKGKKITTIEGNTSSSGSQDNGGMVMKKTRYASQVVGVCRPPYKAEEEEDMAQTMKDDIKDHWAEEYIRRCIKRKIFDGYPDGSFAPDKVMTRAEVATVIDRLITLLVGEEGTK